VQSDVDLQEGYYHVSAIAREVMTPPDQQALGQQIVDTPERVTSLRTFPIGEVRLPKTPLVEEYLRSRVGR
jgi:hypothetical protein